MLQKPEILSFFWNVYMKVMIYFILVQLITKADVYAVQQDTQNVQMSKFYSALMLALHVLDLIGPSSGAFYKLFLQILYVVIRVLRDTSSPYEVTAGRVELFAN